MDLGPLAGFTVGVTADRRAGEQAELLRQQGAHVVRAPTLRSVALERIDELRRATEALVADPPEVLVLTTALGTRTWFSAADSSGCGGALLDALRPARVLARGPKTAGAAVAAGLDARPRAGCDRGRDLVADLSPDGLDGVRVALQLDGGESADLAHALRAAGAQVVEVPVYRWSTPEDPGPARRLVEAACEGRLDAVTFTAAPAVHHLFGLAEGMGRAAPLGEALAGRVVAACIGPVCAEAAEGHGVPSPLQPHHPRLGALVQALAGHFTGRARTLAVDGGEVTLQGGVAVVGGQALELTDRERALLAVLAERPGAVVSKATLLERVWGPGAADEHAVEVAVARLRSRLGPVSAIVQTAARRGYRLADVSPTGAGPGREH